MALPCIFSSAQRSTEVLVARLALAYSMANDEQILVQSISLAGCIVMAMVNQLHTESEHALPPDDSRLFTLRFQTL